MKNMHKRKCNNKNVQMMFHSKNQSTNYMRIHFEIICFNYFFLVYCNIPMLFSIRKKTSWQPAGYGRDIEVDNFSYCTSQLFHAYTPLSPKKLFSNLEKKPLETKKISKLCSWNKRDRGTDSEGRSRNRQLHLPSLGLIRS